MRVFTVRVLEIVVRWLLKSREIEVHDLDVSGNIPSSSARRQNLTEVQYLRRLLVILSSAR